MKYLILPFQTKETMFVTTQDQEAAQATRLWIKDKEEKRQKEMSTWIIGRNNNKKPDSISGLNNMSQSP